MPTPHRDAGRDDPIWQRIFAFGRLLGMAVFHHEVIPMPLSPVLFVMMTGGALNAGHVKALEPDGKLPGPLDLILKPNGLSMLKDYKDGMGEELVFMTEEEVDAYGNVTWPASPLCPQGENISVTEENKAEYVQLLAEHYLYGHCRREIQVLLNGFGRWFLWKLCRNLLWMVEI